MADRRNAADQDKVQQHQEFLEKFNIRPQMKDALLKLIENRPEHPMLFLAKYFDSISTVDKTDRLTVLPLETLHNSTEAWRKMISDAAQTLQLSHHSCPAFQSNITVAYDKLSAPKNPSSKKLANKRSGLSGSVHQDLIKFLCKEMPEGLAESLSSKVCCRWNEMVPFEVFRYSVTALYVLQDFLKLSEDLYHILSGRKENAADSYICQATINSFKEALLENYSSDVPRALEVGRRLRPDSLAFAMLQAKEEEGDSKQVIEMEEFVQSMAEVYLDNVKCIR